MSNRTVAIVTGASRGIGAAIARRLARQGMAVVVNYASRADEAQAVVAAILADGGEAIAVAADVADPVAVRRLFDAAETAFGRIDVLVNNAGVIPNPLTPLADTDEAVFDRLFAINVKGSFNTLREAATRLQPGGRIVNFSSSVVGLALPGYAAYAGTKAAIETITNIFAKELRGRDITVNAVAPGPTATDLFLDGKNAETIERLTKAAPLERLGQPEDIADTVAFLVGPEGGWINGQTVRVNGGIV
ncbi:SDR family oxidoreductase [Chitinimonas koreensis]|uniref:SDR family oxidoreductase n=1 Tax=Chitinimonas koreensis TaxID=356302 RepID=UPI00040A937D|nr:SDR family oxidoreductase [Chitinimonas koreensis]QNM95061.1 SDR family oxidoreductase [Chitinimonas koreensis]